MFDVSWVDPERETVGERRSRKGQGRGSVCASRDGPSLPSQASPRSSPRKASTSKRPTTSNVFGPSTLYMKRGALTGGGRQSRSSSTLRLDGPKQRYPGTTSSDSSFQETPRTSTTTARTPETDLFSDSYKSDCKHSRFSSPSEASDSRSNSTWSLNADSISSTGKIVQQLSPTSYVTQSTEITISSREAMKDTEQVAIMVHISASGTVHVHDEEPASRRPSQAAILDFLNDNSNDDTSDEREISEDRELPKTPEPQALSPPPIWQPVSWEPPEVWGCSKDTGGGGKKDVPLSFKTRGLGLPFRPVTGTGKPRNRERDIIEEKDPRE